MSGLLECSSLLTEELANESVDMCGIFPRGFCTIIAGEPGIGKTWLMLSIAQSVAEGSVGIGSCVTRYPKGRALIFAGETGISLLAQRAQLLGGIKPLESVRVISSHELAKMDIDCMVNTAIGRKNIESCIDEFRPDVVFIDTLISFMGDGKDESSQVDMTDSLRGLSGIASKYNLAMILLHHFRKRAQGVGGNKGLDDVIGTSAFTRLAGMVIGIEKKNNLRTVRCLKSWWQEFAPFQFVIKNEGANVVIKQDYGFEVDGTRSITHPTRERASAILETFGSDPFTIIEVMAELGCSRDSARSAITYLLSARKLTEETVEGQREKVYNAIV